MDPRHKIQLIVFPINSNMVDILRLNPATEYEQLKQLEKIKGTFYEVTKWLIHIILFPTEK